MAIEGPLRELKLEDVLQLLDLTRKTGVLTVRSERLNDEALVHFETGAIVFASRRRSARRLGQQLLRAGRVTERELERALELQRQDPMQRLGEILLEMGSVDEGELDRHLRLQIEETVYDLMAWDEGYFRFEEVQSRVPVRRPLAIRVESLLMEGARRIDEWSRLEDKVPSVDVVPVLSMIEGDDEPLSLRAEEWEILSEIDGERPVRQIAADLGRSSFEIARLVYALATIGLVKVENRSPRTPQRELEKRMEEVRSVLAAGDAERAAQLASELQAAFPERGDLALLSGRALAAQGRMRAATEAFDRAVTLDPLSAEAHHRLGHAALRVGDLTRAERAWANFLRLAPDDPARAGVARALEALRALLSTVSDGAMIST